MKTERQSERKDQSGKKQNDKSERKIIMKRNRTTNQNVKHLTKRSERQKDRTRNHNDKSEEHMRKKHQNDN